VAQRLAPASTRQYHTAPDDTQAGMLSTLYVPYVVRCTLYVVRWLGVLYVPLVRSCTLALGHQVAAAAAASLMHPAGLWPLKDTYISDVFTNNTML
jgi:hypothetical protein